ncbi:DUF2339 domain-containing protein [Candidatus Obscuribacterales bacterium]|nr:DUF2339 domain-containing protein [Candidatus Obscuribacterales bacterium]
MMNKKQLEMFGRDKTLKNPQSKKQTSLETKIGLYWLHRLGVVSLVFGVMFLITYSIQLFGNPFLETCLKLGSGIAVSIILIFFGRHMAKNDNQKWFGHGLTAGGWSLAYFTTYAAHYIPETRIISSLPLETILLSTVAVGSLFSSLRARSELMAIYSVTLAALTILMNGPAFFGAISFLIIAIVASILGNTQSWRRLFSFALASCYIGLFYCSFDPKADPFVATGFLFAMWTIFSIGIGFSLRIPETARNSMTVLACVNAMIFATGFAVSDTARVNSLHQILFVFAGVLYLGMYKFLSQHNQEQHKLVHSLLGLFFINISKCMHFSGLTMLSVDVLQIGLLAVVGLKYKIKSFNWVAVALTVVFIPLWLFGAETKISEIAFGFNAWEYARIGLSAAATMAALAFLYEKFGEKEVKPVDSERDSLDELLANEPENSYTYFYHLVANVMVAGVIVARVVEPSWQVFGLAALATANLIVGVKRNSNYFSFVGLVPLVLGVGLACVSIPSWSALPLTLATVLLFVHHGVSRIFSGSERAENVEIAHWVSPTAGIALLTALILLKAPADYVSLGLGIEGAVFVTAGFLLKESFFRYSGLSILAMLTFKLLFVDLANHNTLERILSFIAAGVVFLASSYLYARFTQVDSADDGSGYADGEDENGSEASDDPIGALIDDFNISVQNGAASVQNVIEVDAAKVEHTV